MQKTADQIKKAFKRPRIKIFVWCECVGDFCGAYFTTTKTQIRDTINRYPESLFKCTIDNDGDIWVGG